MLKPIALGIALGLAASALTPAYAADKYVPPILEDVLPKKTTTSPWEGLYIEGGLGLSAGTADASMGGYGVSLGDTSWAAHVGVGYDLQIRNSPVVLGVLARYEFSDVAYDALGLSLADVENSVLVGGRIGFAPNAAWMAYLLAGYRFGELDPNAALEIKDIDTSGFVIGGGVEVQLGGGLFAGLEYLAQLENGETIEGVKVEASDHTGKVRFGYKF